MQSSRTLASFDCLKRGRFMMKSSQSEEGWELFWTLSGSLINWFKISAKFPRESTCSPIARFTIGCMLSQL